MKNPFTIEEFEVIRLLAWEKQKTLQARINNYCNDSKISPEKKQNGIDDAEAQIAQLELISAKAMQELSKNILNEKD